MTYFQIMNQNIINGLFRSCENGDLQHIVDYFEKNPQTDLIVDDNQITLLQVAAANNQVSSMAGLELGIWDSGWQLLVNPQILRVKHNIV